MPGTTMPKRVRPSRADGRLSAETARYMLKTKAGTLEGMYYAIGVEVPPRNGSVFSMRYTEVASARAGFALLKKKLARKRVGMVGEVILALAHRGESVSLGGYIRRARGVFEEFPGDYQRGALVRGNLPKNR